MNAVTVIMENHISRLIWIPEWRYKFDDFNPIMQISLSLILYTIFKIIIILSLLAFFKFLSQKEGVLLRIPIEFFNWDIIFHPSSLYRYLFDISFFIIYNLQLIFTISIKFRKFPS